MFGISIYEVLVIVVVALILLKPSEFVSILFNIGKVLKKVKTFMNNMQTDIEDMATLGDYKDYVIKDKKTNKINNNTKCNSKKNN